MSKEESLTTHIALESIEVTLTTLTRRIARFDFSRTNLYMEYSIRTLLVITHSVSFMRSMSCLDKIKPECLFLLSLGYVLVFLKFEDSL